MKLSRRRKKLPFGAARLLAVFEGVSGGFAVGTGVVLGLSLASLDRRILLFTAIVGILVNGFNSASVKYSSEHYMDELDGREHGNFWSYFWPAAIQLVAYIAISLLSVIPLIYMHNIMDAVFISCFITLVILFTVGFIRGRLLSARPIRDGLEMVLLGSGIMFVGWAAGAVTHVILGA